MANEKNLARRIAQLEARNKRVEADKAWETSWIRRLLIMILTYIVVVIYLRFVVHIDPWINALVPVIGYSLSTITVSWVKNYWLKRNNPLA
jgi:hypothetical protein